MADMSVIWLRVAAALYSLGLLHAILTLVRRRENLFRVALGAFSARWWTVFHDPTLDRLIVCAYRQNLTLREASFRVLQARALLGIARGEIFPQTQNAAGGFQRIAQKPEHGQEDL